MYLSLTDLCWVSAACGSCPSRLPKPRVQHSSLPLDPSHPIRLLASAPWHVLLLLSGTCFSPPLLILQDPFLRSSVFLGSQKNTHGIEGA